LCNYRNPAEIGREKAALDISLPNFKASLKLPGSISKAPTWRRHYFEERSRMLDAPVS